MACKQAKKMKGGQLMQYVRKWRLQVAGGWLRETDMHIAEIAEKLDCESEPYLYCLT